MGSENGKDCKEAGMKRMHMSEYMDRLKYLIGYISLREEYVMAMKLLNSSYEDKGKTLPDDMDRILMETDLDPLDSIEEIEIPLERSKLNPMHMKYKKLNSLVEEVLKLDKLNNLSYSAVNSSQPTLFKSEKTFARK